MVVVVAAPQVWLLTLVSLVAMVVVMARVATAEASLYNTRNSNIMAKAAIWGLKAFTQEGSEWLPPHDAGRVLVTTWLLASLVFMSSYSGILTAMLTVPRVTIPIDSLADLVAQNDLPWRLEAGSMMFQYFQVSDGGWDIINTKRCTAYLVNKLNTAQQFPLFKALLGRER
ncbi:glutamate receptor 1-like [Scylla paramamosain]|uniref:glutamate receptor 1-like n=1 Tax=Scylla paramamosain TaxID=85552 RepID=UPI003083A484